jgi:PAS domain S-box-containing protein
MTAVEKILGNEAHLVSPLLNQLRRDKDRSIYLVSCVQSKYLFVDNSFKELTGYSSAALLDKGLEFWIPLIHPDDKPGVMEAIIEGHRQFIDPDFFVVDLRPMVLTYRFKNSDGKWIWMQETKWVIPSEDNAKDLILGSLTDISRLRQEQDALLLQNSNSANNLLKVALQYKHINKKKENPNIDLLTKREKEILKLIASGLSSKQISEELFISINTVETHRRHLLSKLQVKNSMELVKEASKTTDLF